MNQPTPHRVRALCEPGVHPMRAAPGIVSLDGQPWTAAMNGHAAVLIRGALAGAEPWMADNQEMIAAWLRDGTQTGAVPLRDLRDRCRCRIRSQAGYVARSRDMRPEPLRLTSSVVVDGRLLALVLSTLDVDPGSEITVRWSGAHDPIALTWGETWRAIVMPMDMHGHAAVGEPVLGGGARR